MSNRCSQYAVRHRPRSVVLIILMTVALAAFGSMRAAGAQGLGVGPSAVEFGEAPRGSTVSVELQLTNGFQPTPNSHSVSQLILQISNSIPMLGPGYVAISDY